MADTKFFVILITLLFLVTVPIALIIQSYNDWNANITEDMSSCPEGIAFCPSASTLNSEFTLTGNVSLAENDYLNTSLLMTDLNWHHFAGVGTMYRPGLIPIYDSWLLVNGIQPDQDGYYTTNYLVNDTVNGVFKITLHGKRTADGMYLEVTNDGFKIPSHIPYLYDFTYSYPNLFSHDMLYIRTKYNPVSHNLVVSLDGSQLFDTTTPSPIFYTIGDSSNYYGGIGTKTDGLTLISYYAENGIKIAGGTEKSTTILDEVWKLVPYHDQIETFVNTIGAIANPFNSYGTDLTGEKLIPWWLTALVDIILIGIVAYGITILRGN